jgi:hypothetical protein
MKPTRTRVQSSTNAKINERIRLRTERNLAIYSSGPEEILARLDALDREWDVERMLEISASTLAVISLVLGILAHWAWMLLTFFVLGFLFLHAIQGWCPPVPVLRRFGVRTSAEIEEERYALKLLRGDFSGLPAGESVNERASGVLNAVER